jgi:hypothetical protein
MTHHTSSQRPPTALGKTTLDARSLFIDQKNAATLTNHNLEIGAVK